MYALSYVRPDSVAQAVAFLQEHEEAKPLSGGMTLVPTLKQRLANPSHLVDLSNLPELRGIEVQRGVLRIGAAMRHVEVARSEVVAGTIPALAYLAGQIADPQVRNRGTMGGSVANNDPAADYPSAVLGLGAMVITNRRRIAADDFFVGMFETALESGELVVAVEYPIPDRANYAKYRHPASGYAVVGVFIALAGAAVRVAVTGAGPSVFRWKAAEAALQNRCDERALDGLKLSPSDVIGDVHTSAAHKAHLVSVFARQAIAGLRERPVNAIAP
jgi:carbon-monoxide dehydrogenase medium subunit